MQPETTVPTYIHALEFIVLREARRHTAQCLSVHLPCVCYGVCVMFCFISIVLPPVHPEMICPG